MFVVVTGAPNLPVYAGGRFTTNLPSSMTKSDAIHSVEIQAKDLGMKVEVFDPDGNNIEHTGQPGELVCTRPHPSLPLGFWGDDSGKKLREAYFSMYPG